ncbi:MAG: hypothetical protein AB7O96_16575 [Pseudobdellovibrionaceae bacterium]
MANDSKKTSEDLLEEAKGKIGDTLKKVFTTGVSAAFMTEESIRAYLSEIKLPKEVLNVVIQSANKSKDEITAKVTKEIVGMFQKIDWVKEMSRFAEAHKFKITTEIEVTKKGKSEKADF